MTTLAAWTSVDSRSPSACYLVSDSRMSWPNGTGWDSGQKLFTSRRFPDIFGYCGDVQFPTLAFRQVLDLMDQAAVVSDDSSLEARNRFLTEHLQLAYQSYPAKVSTTSTILHFGRQGSGMSSVFMLWRLDWSSTQPVTSTLVQLPIDSALGVTIGSGSKPFIRRDKKWKDAQGRTSRGIFSTFCDAISSGEDPRSGGPPQLVGIYRTGVGRMFGVVVEEQLFLAGTLVQSHKQITSFEWRNRLFERMDPLTLGRLPGAQAQPRPD